ncbi:MAG: MATE family efflux transporter [Victivallales bacterium]|nr:MATE family efflux transporter [Victivallales bacterium]
MPISEKKSDFMGTEPVGKLLVKFATPAILSATINCAYNVVDRLYIGRGIGPDAQAGLALTFPIMIILLAFGVLVGIGSSSVVSILLGEKRQDLAEKVLGQAFAMFCLFIFTFQALGLVFLDKILVWFGGTEQAIPYAHKYLSIILWGNIFQHISFGLGSIIRAEGNANKCMLVIFLGAGLNIILDPIFIFTFNLGIAGAAYATVLSMIAGSAWVMAHFCLGQGVLRLRLRNIRIFKGELLWRVLSVGIAPCLMQIVHSSVVIVYNHSFKHFAVDGTQATLAIGAFGIVNSVLMFMLMPAFGIMQGSQPIIGYNYGAKNFLRVRRTLRTATGISAAICFMMTLVMLICARYFALCFSKDAALIDLSSHALRVTGCGFTFIAIGMLTTSYYQSVGKAGLSIFLSLTRQIIILIPAIIILPRVLGFKGIWWSGPISDLLSALIASIFFVYECRKLRRMASMSGELKQ